MSEKRLVRLYLGGKVSCDVAERIAGILNRFYPPLFDGYWNTWKQVTVEKLVGYAREDKWIEIKCEDAIDGVIGDPENPLTYQLQEECVPYDEHTPPFGELPGVIAYYRPACRIGGRLLPLLRVSRSCDFYGNPQVHWDDGYAVLKLLKERKSKLAREKLEMILGQHVPELLPFTVEGQ